jgi:cytochrome c oxidase cbb3-type subunit 4
MDIEWMRSAMTVIAFVTFVGIVLWAWSSRKRHDFDVAAQSIFAEEDSVGERNAQVVRGRQYREERKA